MPYRKINNYLSYKNSDLLFDRVNVNEMARKFKTPLYIYSEKAIKKAFNSYRESVKNNGLVCFAVKANSSLQILRLIASLGGGADIVSGGELYKCLKAGINPKKIVYSGVCKTKDEIEFALKSKILMFNVESISELKAINSCANKLRLIAGISFRLNPNISVKTHPYISTSFKTHKFGVSEEELQDILLELDNYSNIKLIGLSCHIGSQITEIKSFAAAIDKLTAFICRNKLQLKYIDVGGGLGIQYKDKVPPSIKKYVQMVLKKLKPFKAQVIFEPGRSIVGNAGILVGQVHYIKRNEYKTFYLSDVAMNDLIRPAFYDAYHEVLPCRQKTNKGKEKVDLVGPICETSDFIFRDRKIAGFEEGDKFAILSAGAYGYSMSSNYNMRTRAAEVMITASGKIKLITRRETLKEIVQREV